MKKFYALVAALTLVSTAVYAQSERLTGLPKNYPDDGKFPSWYKGCPEKPLVSYHALTYAVNPQEITEGEIYCDAATGKSFATSKAPERERMGVYVIDDCCYIMTGSEKRLLKIPTNQLGGGATQENSIIGFDYLASSSREIVTSEPVNYKDRLAMHQVIKTSNLSNISGNEEVGTYETWVDCETGIVLATKENSGYGGPNNEIYNIKIGPQPASIFNFPEDYEIVDLQKAGGLMGLITGKSQEENTKQVQSEMDVMKDAIQQMQQALEKFKK